MPSGFAPGPPVAIRAGVAGWKPSGIPAARVERLCALVSSSFPSRLGAGGYLAPPVTCAKAERIPAEGVWTGENGGKRGCLPSELLTFHFSRLTSNVFHGLARPALFAQDSAPRTQDLVPSPQHFVSTACQDVGQSIIFMNKDVWTGVWLTHNLTHT
jgi:hypothetical protein